MFVFTQPESLRCSLMLSPVGLYYDCIDFKEKFKSMWMSFDDILSNCYIFNIWLTLSVYGWHTVNVMVCWQALENERFIYLFKSPTGVNYGGDWLQSPLWQGNEGQYFSMAVSFILKNLLILNVKNLWPLFWKFLYLLLTYW